MSLLRARDLLKWNSVLPNVRVVPQDEPEKATQFYMVVADYGWAERILCTGSYQQDAEAIVAAIQEAIRPFPAPAEDGDSHRTETET